MRNNMFISALALLILVFTNCSKSDNDCTEISFGESFEYSDGDVFCLNDIYEITISEVKDERCPCDIVCIWEGQFVFEIKIMKGDEVQSYTLPEKVIVNTIPPFNLDFTFIRMKSNDSCSDPIDVEDLVFEMSINQF